MIISAIMLLVNSSVCQQVLWPQAVSVCMMVSRGEVTVLIRLTVFNWVSAQKRYWSQIGDNFHCFTKQKQNVVIMPPLKLRFFVSTLYLSLNCSANKAEIVQTACFGCCFIAVSVIIGIINELYCCRAGIIQQWETSASVL